MYHHLSGRLTHAAPASIVVECGGVGYQLRIPLSTFEGLPAVGKSCTILVHLYVREDAMDLYGFLTPGERVLFRKLIGVSGVGPTAALAIMSHNSIGDIVGAVRRAEPAALMRAKGIGRKTAERVALELKGSLAELEALAAPGTAAAALSSEDPESVAAQALMTLGYSETDSLRAAKDAAKALGSGAAQGDLLREALKRIR